MPRKKRNVNQGVAVYNRILREFTKINNQLPEDRKLSLAQRRSLISEQIYPQYLGLPEYKLRVRELRNRIISVIEPIPPKEICDINLIDPSALPVIDVFGIDEYLQTVIPDCIYVRVNADEFGVTNIFNTREYNYIRNGVRDIVENIRSAMEDGNLPSTIDFAGYKKLRPKKRNDGSAENYFLDFILNVAGEPIADSTVVQFELPRTKEIKKKETKIRNVLLDRLKKLASKKRRKKRSTKSHRTNVTKLKKIKRRISRATQPKTLQNLNLKLLELYNKTMATLDRDFQNGLMTPEQYQIRKQQVYDNFLKMGGQINENN
jgi:hypothetical protein